MQQKALSSHDLYYCAQPLHQNSVSLTILVLIFDQRGLNCYILPSNFFGPCASTFDCCVVKNKCLYRFLGCTWLPSPIVRFLSKYTVTSPSLSPIKTQSVSVANCSDVIFTPGAAGSTMVGSRLKVDAHRGLLLVHVSNQTEIELDYGTDRFSLSVTYMLEFKSQISTCSSVIAPNTVAHFGDHLMLYTGFLVEVKPNKGVSLPCFHS